MQPKPTPTQLKVLEAMVEYDAIIVFWGGVPFLGGLIPMMSKVGVKTFEALKKNLWVASIARGKYILTDLGRAQVSKERE